MGVNGADFLQCHDTLVMHCGLLSDGMLRAWVRLYATIEEFQFCYSASPIHRPGASFHFYADDAEIYLPIRQDHRP